MGLSNTTNIIIMDSETMKKLNDTKRKFEQFIEQNRLVSFNFDFYIRMEFLLISFLCFTMGVIISEGLTWIFLFLQSYQILIGMGIGVIGMIFARIKIYGVLDKEINTKSYPRGLQIADFSHTPSSD